MWWWTPVIPATQEAKMGGSLESRVQEVKSTVSHDYTTALQLGWQNETLSKKKNSLNLLLVISVVSNYSQIDNAGGNLVITMGDWGRWTTWG